MGAATSQAYRFNFAALCVCQTHSPLCGSIFAFEAL